MLHVPGVVQSSPTLAIDAFQMAKADGHFQFSVSICGVGRAASSPFDVRCALNLLVGRSIWRVENFEEPRLRELQLDDEESNRVHS
jgi:hypothetical protein